MIIGKSYYIKTLTKELGLDNCSIPTANSTYTSCQMSSEDIVNTNDTFMKSLGIELSDDDKRIPYLHWTPKLHKSPVKHVVGSMDQESSQQFQMWFSEHFFAPKLAGLFVTPIVCNACCL